MSQSGQKTEKPTPRREEKARKDGQLAISREAIVAVQLIAFVYLLGTYGAAVADRMMLVSRALIESAFYGEWTAARFVALWRASFLADFGRFLLEVLQIFVSRLRFGIMREFFFDFRSINFISYAPIVFFFFFRFCLSFYFCFCFILSI